jgi:ADP-ribose pyrophosphatase YjhB (NUDIX family)
VDQVRRAAMVAFRVMPAPLRRAAVRAGTPSYTVGAVAVLRRDDGRVLFVDQRHSGGWALPGGLLRRGESPDDAVIREVAEEVGVTLTTSSLPVPVAAVNARLRRVDLVYLLDAPAGADPHQEDEAEVRRVGWYPLAALPDVSEPTLEILRTVRVR